MKKRKKILVVGSSNIDFVLNVPEMPRKGETLLCRSFANVPGGKGANQACACGKLGGDCTFLSVLGRDSLGQLLYKSLENAGVDLSRIGYSDTQPSGMAMITVTSKGRIVLATVKGDVHDIGKNIVRVILENYGFEVLDLGRDVPVETVVDTVRQKDVHLVGLSALMTTTLKSMEETIAALHAAKLDCKIMVGGAVLTPEYAKKIGADWYAKDAKCSADIAKEFFGV